MGVFLLRTVVLTCSLLLALPPGFCCFVGARDCCSPKQQTKEIPAQPLHGNCCHEETPSQAPAKSPSLPKPSQPGKTICCQEVPADRPAVERHLPDLTATVAALVPVAGPTVLGFVTEAAGQGFAFDSAPLHVLHCVWLC
jgi:hypothetical protein